METKEIGAVADKRDYADICIYVKQVEAINLAQLYRALTSYLSFLTLPGAEQYLEIYQTHLSDPYSWLSKAQSLSQAETQRELAKERVSAAHSALDQVLWDDAAKKINYLIESWDADVYSACQQIVHGISMLINEHIPLDEVQAEIIEFAAGRGVFPPEITQEDSVAQQLDRLLFDASINSSSILVKLARTVAVQAELFLNRLTQTVTSFDRLDTRQSFLFEANYKLCAFLKTQSQDLRTCLSNFPAKIAERVAKRLDRIDVAAVLQRYTDCLQLEAVEESHDVFEENDNTEEHQTTWPTIEPMHETVPEVLTEQPFYNNLEQLIASSEQLLTNIIEQISLHRLQLSCSSRIKTCYGKFSLFPLFRQIAAKLMQCQTEILRSLSELTTLNKMTDTAQELNQRLGVIIDALKNSLAQISTYLTTLNVHHEDHDVNNEIPTWHSKLHDLILGSSEKELATLNSRLQRIETMHSPYLRATLVMKLDAAKLKLNDMIIANMQSWSSRLVDRETVVNTLSYLGIHIHPNHLNKIAPNIRIVKKKIVSKKDLYSNAAIYGRTALKNVRAWLNK